MTNLTKEGLELLPSKVDVPFDSFSVVINPDGSITGQLINKGVAVWARKVDGLRVGDTVCFGKFRGALEVSVGKPGSLPVDPLVSVLSRFLKQVYKVLGRG